MKLLNVKLLDFASCILRNCCSSLLMLNVNIYSICEKPLTLCGNNTLALARAFCRLHYLTVAMR